MVFTARNFGWGALLSLAWLIGSFCLTAILFEAAVLGLIARIAVFHIFRFLKAAATTYV